MKMKSVDASSLLNGNYRHDTSIVLLCEALETAINAWEATNRTFGIDVIPDVSISNGTIHVALAPENAKKTAPISPVTPTSYAKATKDTTATKRKNWLRARLYEFESDPNAHLVSNSRDDRTVTIVVTKNKNGHRRDDYYTATASPDDLYDINVGIAVAYARAKNKAVPDYI